MASTVSDAAIEVIEESLRLAKGDPLSIGVRLRVAGGAVRPRFVEHPEEGDETVVVRGVRVFISREILDLHGSVRVDVTPEHGQLVVRPIGS